MRPRFRATARADCIGETPVYAQVPQRVARTRGTPMTDSTAGLKLSDYQFQALKADKSPEPSLAFPLLGLFGEAGSLLSVVKKKQRDKASYLGYAPNVIEEFGDVLWYFAVVASRGRTALADIANNINRGFFDW